MGHRFKAAVFDLDGTLLDTSEGVFSSVRCAVGHLGLAPLSDAQIKTFIGPPIQDSFARTYGLDAKKAQEAAAIFRNHYKDFDLLKAKPYQGIYDVFQALLDCGIVPAIATYKREDYARTILIHFGFNKYTDIMYGADYEGKLKKKDIIKKALTDAGAFDYRDAVMIGDSDNDAKGAQDIDTNFIGVTYGFGFKTSADVDMFPNIGAAADTIELKRLLTEG